MTTTRRGYVFGTFLSSCAALVLLIVACATNVWITSQLESSISSLLTSNVNFGLFTGTFDRTISPQNVVDLDITIVCDFGENVCIWSCLDTSELRKIELAVLLSGGTSFCSGGTSLSSLSKSSFRTNGSRSAASTRDATKEPFMNAGFYLSTVIMVMLALLATTVAALLGVINAASNPTRSWLAVESLYYWNGAAAGFDCLCLILWGTHFATDLKSSVGLVDVISGLYSSDGLAQLGWSYWLVLVALVISASNIALLFWRDYLIRKEPPPPEWNPEKEAADGTLILY